MPGNRGSPQVRQAARDLPEEQRAHTVRGRGGNYLRGLLELAGIAGVSVRKVSVRNQRQRWGSCSPSGLICLNWRLITMPELGADYVLYHELMHLKRMTTRRRSGNWSRRHVQVSDTRRWLRRHALAPHSA